MNTRLSLLIAVSLFLLAHSATQAQFAFGMQNFVAKDDAYAKVSIPAATWSEIVKSGKEGLTEKDACLLPTAGGQLSGYQADFDGDGKEEIWVLYSNQAASPACNVLATLVPAGGGSFQLLDVLTLQPGSALIRPINTLDEGVQLYVQNTYTLPDGTPESKGLILGMKQGLTVILISWTQKDGMIDGKKTTQSISAAFSDINYDNRKELFLDFRTHPAGTKATDKNLIDRYIITLDFLPNHLRYGIYDSSGFDKVKEADMLAKTGERLMAREETRDDGIAKVREALRVNPFLTKSRVNLGKFLLNLGKYSDAEKNLLVAREFDRDFAKTHKLLGDTYVRLNDLQKALECYTTYLDMVPKNSNTLDVRQARINVRQITVWRKK